VLAAFLAATSAVFLASKAYWVEVTALAAALAGLNDLSASLSSS